MDFFCICPHLNYLEFEFLLDLSLIAVITSAWQKFLKSPFQSRCAHANLWKQAIVANGQSCQDKRQKGHFFQHASHASLSCWLQVSQLMHGRVPDAIGCLANLFLNLLIWKIIHLFVHSVTCKLFEDCSLNNNNATLFRIFWRFKCMFHFFGARGTRFFRFFFAVWALCGSKNLAGKTTGSQVWPRAWKILDEAASQGA